MTDERPISISGVVPELTMAADSAAPRSESGIGALATWADRLWAITYVSHGEDTGSGTGLYEIDEDLSMHQREESVVGTYANRMIHPQSDQLMIGPHLIDADRTVRTVDGILEDPDGEPNRLAATMEHLDRPDDLVYVLTMEGLLYEVNVQTLAVDLRFDLNEELSIPDAPEVTHFKSGHTAQGRVIVANNSYAEPEYEGERAAGRLAEWDGDRWRTVREDPFNEVAGRKNMGEVAFAVGWDDASAILEVLIDGEWSTYRLPKASHTYDHMWTTEWTRIREVEHERFLMDCHGTFYELAPYAYGGTVHGVRPVSTHLRVVPDFCSFGGLFVMGGDQATPSGDTNLLSGQPRSGLWLGKTDDLWEFGDPKGWGGPWRESSVTADEPSDPYLLTGFDEKTLHLRHDADESVAFRVEVDFLGDHSWERYETVEVDPVEYVQFEFPDAFSAHWVRLVPDASCTATGYFTYT